VRAPGRRRVGAEDLVAALGADASRISAIGFSRGAGVSLITALRDKRIKSVFDIAGPTDFFAPSIQQVSFAIAAGQPIEKIASVLLTPYLVYYDLAIPAAAAADADPGAVARRLGILCSAFILDGEDLLHYK